MKKSIKIIIIEDQKILREAISNLLESVPEFDVIGKWPDAKTALEHSDTASANVALVDLHLPGIDGIEFTSIALDKYHHLKAIIMTVYENEAIIHKAFKAGAAGYISKNVSIDELSFAIRSVHRGQVFLSPDLTKPYIDWIRDHHNDISCSYGGFLNEHITMLRMARDGKSNKEIAEFLSIPVTTVKSQFSILMKKLNANDRTHCVVKAMRQSIIEMEENQ